MIVVGVVGKQSTGKDVLVDYLSKNYGFEKLSTGDIVRDLAEDRGLPKTRLNLQKVASDLIANEGENHLARRLLKIIRSNNWNKVGITGLRTPSDVRILRNDLGAEFKLVRVYVTNPEVRFHRAKKRGKARDSKNLEDFLRMDQRENELFDLEKTLSMADITINNDGTLEDYYDKIETKVAHPLLHNL